MTFKDAARQFQALTEMDSDIRALERAKSDDPKAAFQLLRQHQRMGKSLTRPQPEEPHDKPVHPSTVRYMQTRAPERFKKGVSVKADASAIDKERAELLDKRRVSRWYELKSRHNPLSNQYPRRGKAADKDDYDRHRSEREPVRQRLKALRAAKRAGIEDPKAV